MSRGIRAIPRHLASPSRAARYLRISRSSVISRPLRSSRPYSTGSGSKFDILFCGSDAFSVVSLEGLLRATDTWKSLRVLVPQEKRKGRAKPGSLPEEGALSQLARSKKLEVDRVPIEGISAYEPPASFGQPNHTSLLITASFGHILPTPFLSHFLPTHRLNVHPSLLPRWRGAAPIQWTVAHGDAETGVTVQRLVEKGKGIDAGEIVGVRSGIPIPHNATYSSLLPGLAEIGGEVLVDVSRRMQEGDIEGQLQDPSMVTRAPKISEKTAQIRWSEQDANELERLSRGISHQEPLWTTYLSQKIQLLDISLTTPSSSFGRSGSIEPGTAALDKKEQCLKVACKAVLGGEEDVSWLAVRQVKPAGRKSMGVMEWWNGLPRGVRAGRYSTLGT